jgi:acyl carrier protein
MDSLEAQLSRCFSAVFPTLGENDIPSASFETVEGWDSIATVNLIGVIEQEFQIDIDPADLDQMVAFQSAATLLRGLARRS